MSRLKAVSRFKAMSGLKKTLLITSGIVVVLMILIILFISPISKYLIEKYDEQYTGRQITMNWAYVNPFTGYARFEDFKVYEFESDSVFLSTTGVSLNFAMLKLFTKTYEISSLTLDNPVGVIKQARDTFNYNDLVEKFSGKQLADTIKSVTRFNALNIKINNGTFHYHDRMIPINYFIKDVNVESSGKRWDTDTIAAKFAFSSGIGSGDVHGNTIIDVEKKDYRLDIEIKKFDLKIVEQYLKELTNYGSFRATLDLNMKSQGNLSNRLDVTNSGSIMINDFHFGKNEKEDYFSFDKLAVSINQLSPSKGIYFYDSVSLVRPYFKYEKYDKLDNIQAIFGVGGSNIAAAEADEKQFNLILEVADYLEMLSNNLLKSHFKVNKLSVYKGELVVNDFSQTEKFSIGFDPLYILADSIDKEDNTAKVSFNANIKPYGQAKATLILNPKDTTDFDLNYSFEGMPVSIFNPFTIAYTSFPMDRGTIELNGKWKVRNSMINSDNHLLIIDPRVGDKVKNKENKWIPMNLLMALVRERGNVIDYSIPITGNLKNPKFHLKDVIFDLLKNIFVKPPTTPYGIQVNNVESEIEKLLTLTWQMRQSELQSDQEKFVKKISDFLEDNPNANITVRPEYYAAKEKEYILFYEAKKRYFLQANNIKDEKLSDKDSVKIDKMSTRDSLFLKYLNKNVKSGLSFTLQQKCARLVGNKIVSAKYNMLNEARINNFMAYFKKKKVDKQITVAQGKEVIPYNGFSLYAIEYKDKFPESLVGAYKKLNKLNDKAPRKKFKDERKETQPVLNVDNKKLDNRKQ